MTLTYTMFHDVILPPVVEDLSSSDSENFELRKIKRFRVPGDFELLKGPVVVFDFETTGLDPIEDDIIEIGAIKLVDGEPVDQYSTLVHTPKVLEEHITKITGLSNKDLEGMPSIEEVLPKFLEFIDQSVLLAHNADFDWNFLSEQCEKLNTEIEWPCFCSLKLARKCLPELESKSLDSLAAHYQLSFESRHRSIGDVKVTCDVLKHLLETDPVCEPVWSQISAIAGVS